LEGDLAASVVLAASLGIASALHCIGMCGGFSWLVAAPRPGSDPGRGRALGRLARFHAGRIATYVFLGTVAGALGTRLLALGASRRALALAGGTLLVAVALERLGCFARLAPRGRALGVFSSFVGRFAALLRELSIRRDSVSLLLFGAANGFLPCAATAAAIALAVSAGSPLAGAVAMLAFGLATLPALVGIGVAGARIPAAAMRRLARGSALVMLAVGAVTIWRAGVVAAAAPCCSAP
jgi:sulfite exporter TauE/SafE